jgi:hypothetical protein
MNEVVYDFDGLFKKLINLKRNKDGSLLNAE